jgi:hypothetical protein
MREKAARWLERLSLWGLAVLLATLPFWRHRVLLHRPGLPVFFEFRDITLYTNDLVWWGAVGAWLLSRIVDPAPQKLRPGPWFVWVPLAGFIALAAAGVPAAVDPIYAAYQALRLVALFGLYLLLVNLAIKPAWIAWPLAAGLVIQALVAVPQFLAGRSLGLGRLGEVTVDAAWPGASVVMVGEARWLRAYGLAQHPNLLAGCLAAMLLLAGGYYLARRGPARLPLLAALGAGFVTLLLTFSRAAWLGALAGGVAALALLAWARRRGTWAPQRSTIMLLAAVLLAVGAVFAALHWPLLQPRLGLTTQGTEIRSVEARKVQIPAAVALIGMRPLLGVGLGNYPTALYRLARETVAAYPVYQPTYSVPLLAAAELGVAGGALWLALIAAPWPALWLRRRRLAMNAWWAGASGALLALVVVSFFDFYVWTSHQGPLALWLVLGVWARAWDDAAGRPQADPNDERDSP